MYLAEVSKQSVEVQFRFSFQSLQSDTVSVSSEWIKNLMYEVSQLGLWNLPPCDCISSTVQKTR